MAGLAAEVDVGELGERIARAGVLRQPVVVEVQLAGLGIADHVLQHRGEAAGGGVDLRLAFGREADHLGVAAALDIEHAVVAPAVLVVADERAGRIGRQRRLARPREAEEQGDVVLRRAVIGAAVHREHPLLGQVIVHDAEDALLDLAGVAGAADQHHALRQVQEDERGAAGAVTLRLGLQVGDVDHREVGDEIRQHAQILLADEHVAGEEVVPGVLGDDADVDAVAGIGAGVAVEDEHVLAQQVLPGAGQQRLELLPLERPVDLPPPDVGVDRRVLDQELVVGRPARVRPRLADQGTLGGQHRLAALHRHLHQPRRRQVPVGRADPLDAVFVQPKAADDRTVILHAITSESGFRTRKENRRGAAT